MTELQKEGRVDGERNDDLVLIPTQTGRNARDISAARWATLVDEHLPILWGALSRRQLTHQEAAQICELVWLRLAARPADIGDELPVLAWLIREMNIELARLWAATMHEPDGCHVVDGIVIRPPRYSWPPSTLAT